MRFAPAIRTGILLAAAAAVLAAGPSGKALLVDGDFEGIQAGKYLRRDDKGQDWYESRGDTKEGRNLLVLSTKKIGGNRTRKAMIKAHPDLNTYLTQRFARAQTGDFTVRFDVYIREILSDDNRSVFFLVGDDRDGKRGANSTGVERFVFMGFENALEPGKINLFAREAKTTWDQRTVVVRDLDLKTWYTVVVVVHTQDEIFEVAVEGVTPSPVPLEAFHAGRSVPKRLTHLSFASWNDGAGTFYVDNVSASEH